MRLNIGLATIFYNEKPGLQNILNTVPPGVVDYWLGIDGPFLFTKQKYPDTFYKSTDGSIGVFNNPKIPHRLTVNLPYKTEFEKRQFYLELCSTTAFKDDIDVLIIIDADECFQYPEHVNPFIAWLDFKRNLLDTLHYIDGKTQNVFNIAFQDEELTVKPRIWVKPAEMRYLGYSHYHYGNIKRDYNKIKYYESFGGTYCQPAYEKTIGPIKIVHNDDLRSRKNKKIREEYKKYITKFEELVLTPLPGNIKRSPELAHNYAML